MPHLEELSINHFRNIEALSIAPIPRINIVVGDNGAGKTSLLECLSYLAHGKSFRTHKYRTLIRQGDSHFTIHGKVIAGQSSQSKIPVGISRYRNGDSTYKVNEKAVKSTTALAKVIPLLVLDSSSFRLLESGPKERRRFFDWLVFHVKHDFSGLWSKLNHCLKQRNSLLRSGNIQYGEYAPWDREIAQIGERITSLRLSCFELLSKQLKALNWQQGKDKINSQDSISLELVSGWLDGGETNTYEEQLRARFETDLRYGYTSIGPQKADIKIRYNGTMATDVLSRGQTKLLIVALHIAKANVLKGVSEDSRPIIAIDDMASELDSINQAYLKTFLDDLGSQVFITGTDTEFLEKAWQGNSVDTKVFHVKHGELC